MALVSNIDTLYASVLVEDYTVVAAALLEDLQEKLEQRFIFRSRTPQYVALGGVNFQCVNGTYSWSYGLKCNDFILYLAHRDNSANYPLYVEFRQEYLWQEGHLKAWDKFIVFFQKCGFKYIKSKISRADLCCHTDLQILDLDNLTYLHFDPRCKTYKDETFSTKPPQDEDEVDLLEVFSTGNKYTGFRIGKGKPLMARIYDKTEEIKISQKGWFFTIWEQEGLDISKTITNIEFEIKREWFWNFQIDTVEDLFENLGSVWFYLTNNYLSFRYHDNDRRSRRTICEWWQEIRVATFDFDGSLLAKRKQVELNIDKAVYGVFGYATSLAAALGYDHLDKAVLSNLWSYMNRMINARGISPTERIRQKKQRKLSPVDLQKLFEDFGIEVIGG
jgi:hypothetical protein